MVCIKCFKELQSGLVGKKSGNSEVIGISVVPNGQLVFSNNFIPIYIKTERLVTKGKNKGNKVKEETLHYFKSSFCPKCGTNFDDEKEKIVKLELNETNS